MSDVTKEAAAEATAIAETEIDFGVQEDVSIFAPMEVSEEVESAAISAPAEVEEMPSIGREAAQSAAGEVHGKARNERLKLVIMLVVVLLATVGVIIWGSIIAERVSSVKSPVAGALLGRFVGRDVTSVGGTVKPNLEKIPSKPVEEGELPGAAEDETVEDSGEGEGGDGVEYPIRRVDLSVDSGNVFALINETPYEPDVISLYAEELKTHTAEEAASLYGADAPRVLVLHTHGTESYFSGGDSYLSDETFRTYDTSKNVVAVGRAFAERQREHGIGVIHIETMFDGEDYNEAYVKSAAEIRRIIEKYPSVEYVFDIHRDAMFTREGVNLAPTSPLQGEGGDAAQIMLVVGTDHAGASHGDWESNLSFALKLQKSTLGINGGIMRGINLRSASFNAQYAKGSVLVEVGAAGNTLDEALRAGKIFADGVAEVILGEK